MQRCLGRSIAGNNRQLYSKINEYNPAQISHELNVTSKQSLEKITAATADVFTAVSEITGRECLAFLGKKPDVITPNGFEDTFVPSAEDFEARQDCGTGKAALRGRHPVGIHSSCRHPAHINQRPL